MALWFLWPVKGTGVIHSFSRRNLRGQVCTLPFLFLPPALLVSNFLAGGCSVKLGQRDRTKKKKKWINARTENTLCFFKLLRCRGRLLPQFNLACMVNILSWKSHERLRNSHVHAVYLGIECQSPTFLVLSLNNIDGSLCPARARMDSCRFHMSKMLCKNCLKLLSSDLRCKEKKKEKIITLKVHAFCFWNQLLILIFFSTWTYSLINSNKQTSSSDINKDIRQPIYFWKYTLSHPFLHLTIHLPLLPGIIGQNI